MSYFKVLGFDKEPFSTSPDPDFFYLSKEHETALANILIDLRLKRGLSVILGDIGTGKTTLSRKLIQELKEREDFIFHIILDPSFENEHLFISSLVKNFEINVGASDNGSLPTIVDLRESLKSFLFQKGVTEKKTVVLIIDEAQKLNENSLEILRVLLNYETNEFKLLQLVLLGQLELHAKIMNMPNFFDRISFKYTLNPLDLKETRQMIEFRMQQAGYTARMHLFLDDAISEIYRYSHGYPRRITALCHKALKDVVMHNRSVANGTVIRTMIEQEIKSGWLKKDLLLQKSSC
ncbi:ExeA family protein [Candidatus Omnitrophota bacterium]